MVDADQVVGLTCSVLHVPCVLMMSSLHCSSLLLCFCVFQLLQYTLLNIGTLRSHHIHGQRDGAPVTDHGIDGHRCGASRARLLPVVASEPMPLSSHHVPLAPVWLAFTLASCLT